MTQRLNITMKSTVLGFLTVTLFLVACTAVTTPVAVFPSQTIVTSATSISTIIPSVTQEPLLSLTLTPTQTSKSIITRVSSSTPTPYQLSLSVVDLDTTGRLWVYDERETRFLIIDMKTGTVEQTLFSQNNCSVVLKYDSTDVICRSSTNLYLFDLMTRNTQNLPVTPPDRLYIAPYVQNSRFLVYGNWSEAGDWLVDVSYFDMMTAQESLVVENSPDSEYYISSDGSYMIAEIDNQVVDLLSNPVKNLTPVGYENLVYNPYSLVWSPGRNLLYIGAADPGSYDFPQTNYYFILDADTGIVTPITIPSDTFRNAMWGAYWSPDNKQVAIPGGPELCILRVDKMIGECTNTIQESGSSVTYLAWSPDSRYIAFSVSDVIYLYDTETRQYFSLLSNKPHTGLIFWR